MVYYEVENFKKIHKYLFKDIYDFAGNYKN